MSNYKKVRARECEQDLAYYYKVDSNVTMVGGRMT